MPKLELAEVMRKIVLIFYIFSSAFIFTNEASIAEEYLIYNLTEIAALNSVWENVNFTNLDIALKEGHPHSSLTVIEIIRLYNYSVETHHVETSDGYILALHRITGNSKNPSPKNKPATLVLHGLLSSSADWVLCGPNKGLGFILADAGYDVWLGNVRGNKFSRKHRTLTVDDPSYWNFSWHELGTHDLTAMIDHILEETGRKKLFYIGHSQGTTMFFTMASDKPEYNDKIQVAFALAPVTYSSRMFSPIFQVLSRLVDPINLLFKLIGIYEFKPTDQFFKKFTPEICKGRTFAQKLCISVLFMIAGFNEDQMDTKFLPAILSHVPAGAGVNQFVHYAQIIKSGHFRQVDLGLMGNLAKYGRITPPSYKLKNVKAPVFLHYSMNDWLSHTKDVHDLYSELPNPVGKFRVPHDLFNHLDFLWAKDAKTLLYDKIVSLMSRYKE